MFLYLEESLGAFSFVPFAVVLLITIIFVIIFLPETKGTARQNCAKLINIPSYEQ